MIKEITTSVTRPNNTTAYTAGDVIGTAASQVLTFNNVSTPFVQGSGWVANATVLSSAAPTTLPSLELWLFKVAPAAAADNSAWAVTDAELLNLIAVLPLATTYVGLASGNHVQQSANTIAGFTLPSGSDTIYGVLVVRNAYTPVASEVYKVKIITTD